MVDDGDGNLTVSRTELRALLREMQREVPGDHDGTSELIPHRGATGRDAEIYARAARDAFDRAKADIQRDMRDAVREATKDFWSGDKIREKIEEYLDDVGLPADKNHRHQTAEAMRGMMKWQKRIDKVLGGMALAVVTAALYALAKLAGINLPLPGSSR